MHTVRIVKTENDEYWQVIFAAPGILEVISVYNNMEDAFGICSYLNGGLPPAGYTMNVQQVGT